VRSSAPSCLPRISACLRRRDRPDAKKETGNYPMPDNGHAISAKRLSRKQRKDGNLTKDDFDRINRKADRVLKGKRQD
jgi:hypothetical protein